MLVAVGCIYVCLCCSEAGLRIIASTRVPPNVATASRETVTKETAAPKRKEDADVNELAENPSENSGSRSEKDVEGMEAETKLKLKISAAGVYGTQLFRALI